MPIRTLTYYRTQWLEQDDNYPTLESVVRAVLKKAPNVNDSAITRSNGQIMEVRHRTLGTQGPVLVHFAAHVPGAEGSLVPAVGAVSSGPLETIAPPKNKNFLDGALVVLVTGDHCLLCTAGLTPAAFRFYVFSMIKKLGLPKKASRFNLAAVANREKISEIIESGVECVGLNGTLDSLLHASDSTKASLGKKVKTSLSKAVAALISQDQDLGKLIREDHSNINTRLVVSFKRRAHGHLDQESFDDAARHIAEEEEPGIYIKLRSGTVIDADRMKLSRKVEIPNHGSTIDHSAAWNELKGFYQELTKDSLLT